MAPALRPVERERIRRLLTDALDRISARKPREKVIERALMLARMDDLPETTSDWLVFIRGPVDEATRAVLGNPAAAILIEDLSPLLMELEPERPRRESAAYSKPAGNESRSATHRDMPESSVRRPISGAQEINTEPPEPIDSQPRPDELTPTGPRLAVRRRSKRINTLSYKQGALDPGAAGNRILVVDDDPSYRSALARTLGANGFEVSTAPDRKTALWMCERLEPRLVLTDYELCDGGTGLDLAQSLRAKLGADAPTVLLVTASTALPKAPTTLVAGVVAKNATEDVLAAVARLLDQD